MAVVLVVGGGGREHAMVHHLSLSNSVARIYAAPGNPGIEGEPKSQCVELHIKNHQEVVLFCQEKSVNLVAVGPEAPLADGLEDSLTKAGVLVFGPSRSAASLEYNKAMAKLFMQRYGIPTARSEIFHEPLAAKAFIASSGWAGWAVKAAGLAGGKGVIVTSDRQEAARAVDLLTASHAQAASTLVVEERLYGEEISAMAFSDGQAMVMMPPAQDHKTRFANNRGPNTGGMGAVCPYPVAPSTLKACQQILTKTMNGMTSEGYPFRGVLYAGLMLCGGKPYVLEYNCRFGDPETQAVLLLLKSDLYQIMKACATSSLAECPTIQFREECASAVVVVTSNYPETADKGLPITGLDLITSPTGEEVKVYHSSTVRGQSRDLLTSGGRVVTVVAVASSHDTARNTALKQARKVAFEGASLRDDIGMQALHAEKKLKSGSPELTYSSAGVNVAKGEQFVETIRGCVASTHGPAVLGGLGGFGALYDLQGLGLHHPVLVSGTDGVGTKLMIANAVGRHDTIGQDLVAMCLNDVLCHGADPLFFLDYLATGSLDLATLETVVKGIAKACKESSLALVGGETAEMPGLYRSGEYDLAGFAVGVVEKDQLLPQKELMTEGDVLIGVASSGFHSNGFSLVRKVVDRLGLKYSDPSPVDYKKTLGDLLLTPTRLYADVFKKVKGKYLGAAHITGGGIIGNAARMLPEFLQIQLDAKRWPVLDEFRWIAAQGIPFDEMARTFNLGLGLILAVKQEEKIEVLKLLANDGAFEVGYLSVSRAGEPHVTISNLQSCLFSPKLVATPPPSKPRVRTAILISGRGSNMMAIVDASREPHSPAEVVLVLSNRPDAQGIQWAADNGIKTAVVNHRDYKDRRSFEEEVHKILIVAGAQLVCLAGFMRILTADFVNLWKDHLINIHPSLLPSFKGKDAQNQALEAKVKITGCTVHFVEAEVDSGDIIDQEAVPVLPQDTEDSLSARIREAEHLIFPRAVLSVAKKMQEFL